MGRESPGKSFSNQTHLECHITHHLRTSKGVWAALGMLRARALPGDQEDLMGFISTMGQVLGGGFWLWRGSRECWEGWGAGSAPRSSSGDQQGSSSPAAGVPIGCDPPRDLGGFGISAGREPGNLHVLLGLWAHMMREKGGKGICKHCQSCISPCSGFGSSQWVLF